MVTAQFATNGSRSLLTPASNYSSSIEALLQAALNIEAGNLGSEPDVDAVTHIFLASDRSFGTPGVFRSRWLSPLTEFVDSNNWNISATALVANNLNDVMENNCTLHGMVCPDQCSLGINYDVSSLPVVCERCGLQLRTISKLNSTQFAAGSCEDFPFVTDVASRISDSTVVHIFSGSAETNSSAYLQLKSAAETLNGYFWPNGTNFTKVLPPIVSGSPKIYTNYTIGAGLTSLIDVVVTQVSENSTEVNISLVFRYDDSQIGGICDNDARIRAALYPASTSGAVES